MSTAKNSFRVFSDDFAEDYPPREVSEIWHVRPYNLENKRTRFLNRQLGITNINYFGNKNGERKKVKQ